MLIENTKDVNTYPLEELYETLMTYELNNVETKDKTRRSKEEMKEPPKTQIALKTTNDEGPSNTNMSDEELDDLVLLVKKWRGFRNNRRFKKKRMTKEKRKTKRSYAMIVTNLVIRGPNVRIKRSSLKRKLFKLHGTIMMKMILKKMKFKKKSPTCASWLLKMR
ncbi:Uncharacterized protein Adt_20991 [Abeliophyllum distichum]|uniref:Uncharacterized protein n=1 Tax=Abeliophyllum distichum TaxID=126358 RepID=A0ABD1SY71_9LAMI